MGIGFDQHFGVSAFLPGRPDDGQMLRNDESFCMLLPGKSYSKKSPTGPTEPTPKKPEYLVARSQLT